MVVVASLGIVGSLVLWPHGWAVQPDKLFLLGLLAASIPVAWVGWRDDVADVPASTRLAIHLGAAAAAASLLPPLFDFMPLLLEKILLVLAWAWFTNLFNFMNGADGLAETEAIWICLGLILLVPKLAPVALVIAGAVLGFLRVNWHPAKVFLGDVASTWLGFMLAGLLLAGVVDDTWYVLWPLAALPLVFCYDATYTLIRRLWGGHNVWQPHKTFWFHRLLRLGLRHDELAYGLLAINILIGLAILLEIRSGIRGLALSFGICLLSALAYRIRIREDQRGLPHDS